MRGKEMRKLILPSMLVFCALTVVAIAQAEEAMMKPPKVLTMTREVLKTGKGAAHEKWEAGWPRMFAKANWPTHYMAMSAITGEPRVLFFTGFESMEDWAKESQAQDKNAAMAAEQATLADKDGDFLTGLTNVVFTYMPELSYHPDVTVAGTRYFATVVFHVKRGHDDHFVEVRKAVLAAHEKAGLGDHYAVYHVVAGGAAGTYVIFLPLKSLAELDAFPTVHGKAYKDALGEDGQKKLNDFDSQGLESSETQIFSISPSMSYPSKDWVQADPEFWGSKPAAPAKTAGKTEKKKEPTKK
jgi:hypothetical protein